MPAACSCSKLPPGTGPCYYCQHPRTKREVKAVVREGIEQNLVRQVEVRKQQDLEKAAEKIRKGKYKKRRT